MQFDGGFGAAETCPRKKFEAKVNGGRIQSVNCLLQFQAKVVLAIEQARPFDESLGQVMIDAPVPVLVGISEGAVGNAAPDAQVIELILAGTKASFDVAETLSVS